MRCTRWAGSTGEACDAMSTGVLQLMARMGVGEVEVICIYFCKQSENSMLTSSQSFKLYETVRRYFTKEEDTKSFIAEVESIIENRFASEKEYLVTKKDLVELGAKLESSIAQSKTDTVKWMFSIFLALALMIIGLYLKK